MTLEQLENSRYNLLVSMASICDQCLKNGYHYVPDERDLQRIEELDNEILKLRNGGMS
jgi:hypothetical protein